MNREKIFGRLRDARERDFTFSSGRILGSMCTLPRAYRMFMETNMGDPELFSGTREVEEEAIDMVGRMLHAPLASGGRMTSGGTESNLTALWIFKNMSGRNEVILRHCGFSRT